MTVILEVDFSEVLFNAVIGEDVSSFGVINKTLSGSGVFESGSLLGGGDFAECGAEVLEGHCFVWGDECRGISPSDAHTISGITGPVDDLRQSCL